MMIHAVCCLQCQELETLCSLLLVVVTAGFDFELFECRKTHPSYRTFGRIEGKLLGLFNLLEIASPYRKESTSQTALCSVIEHGEKCFCEQTQSVKQCGVK